MHGSNRGGVSREMTIRYGDRSIHKNTRNLINCVFYTLLTNHGEFFVPRYNA